MKTFLMLVVLFFSSAVVAERINCSYIYNTESRTFILERSADNFKWTTTSNRVFYLQILYETENVLVLGDMFNYDNYDSGDAFYTLFFEKISKKYRSGTLPHPLNKKMKVPNEWNEGNCIVN